MGRWKMILLLLKIGYNRYSELYWPSYVHFNLEQHSEWVSIGDVPSHPTLVGTCFTFISFNIAAFGLGYLETCPLTPGYVGTCYFINNQHHGYGSITQNPWHRNPFARSHTINITISHHHYRVSLSLDLRLSWLWFIHKPTLRIQQRLRRKELYAMGTIAS